MAQQEFDFSVVDIKVEDTKTDISTIGCFISLDDQEIDCIEFGDIDHRLVLGLERDGTVLRVTAKTLNDNTKIGSISFTSETFHECAQKETKEIWATLFDHEDDDLYDGNFDEDDDENPKILVSLTKGDSPTIRKKGATKTTTTRVSPKKIEVRAPIEATYDLSETVVFSVRTLITELCSLTKEGIETLRADMDDIHAENDEKVAILAHLETLHKELQGENAEDLRFLESLKTLKTEFEVDLGSKKKQIEDELQTLLNRITAIIEDMQKLETEKKEATKESQRLSEIVAIPENTKESGFTEEAKDLREEDSKLRDQSDELTSELIKTRDQRNSYIKDHEDLIEKLEDMVQAFHDQLRVLAGDTKIISYENDKLQREANLLVRKGDYSNKNLVLSQFELKSFAREFKRLTDEYNDSDSEFSRYIAELKKNLRNQDFIISDLKKKFVSQMNHISDLENKSERQLSQIAHFQSELETIDQIKYEERYTKLSGDLRKTEEQRKKHQEDLENAYAGLATKLKLFSGDLDTHKTQRAKQEGKVVENLQNLEGITTETNKLLKEIEVLDTKEFTDSNRNRVCDKLSEERESLDNKLQFYTDEKNKIFKELQDSLSDLKERQFNVSEQEELLISLQEDIQKIRILIQEKRTIIIEIEKDIYIAEERIEELQRLIADRDQEIKDLLKQLVQRNTRIKQLTDTLGSAPPPSPKKVTYKAKKGDEVDQLLAKYIQDCPVPVKRLGSGFYLFGTRKIYAKVMNGKLVIRVGGGYMVIQKFIETYADQELIKIKSILEKEGLSSIDEIDLEDYCLNKSKTAYGNVRGEKSTSASSPGSHGGSFRKSMTSSIKKLPRGSKTIKKVTTTKVIYQG
ncbi:unnamed protein product [Moneuplotes crassus]|uniref:GAR domain-containing protein n=1 Tax=Euplotes crassus TaxID=5936 RepID=A0AAD2D9B9_EUPCR|nr:unnamed protein product [Moneuplotes crassus]